MVAANNAGKSTALARPDHVNILLVSKDIDEDLVTGLHCAIRSFLALSSFLRSSHFNRNFLHQLYWRNIVLGEVSLQRLRHLRSLHELDQSDLGRVVAVLRSRLELRNHARTGLQDGDRVNLTLLVEHL